MQSLANTCVKGRVVEFKLNQWIEFADSRIFHFTAGFALPEPTSLQKGAWIELRLNALQEIADCMLLSPATEHAWNPLSDTTRWHRPRGKPSRMSKLWQRQKMTSEIRNDLYQHEFLEAETPLVVRGACPDSHIESMVVQGFGYLITSSEYQIKRMMTGGFEKVFTLTKNFRAKDEGRFHSQEFTMLEWARGFGSIKEIEDDAVRFIRKAFQALHPGESTLTVLGHSIDFMNHPWEKITVRGAFEKYLGMRDLENFSLNSLLMSANKSGIALPSNFIHDQDLVLSFLLDRLQPYLGMNTPTFLIDWPAFMTSSTAVHATDATVAERSELYIAGIEIADGFPFLQDAKLQRKFFQRELNRRRDHEQEVVAIDELYIETLEQGIPPGAGMALGIDRLAMVLTQSDSLAEVQAFSWSET